MRNKTIGMSLVEVLIALAIAGLVAMLTIPKFLAGNKEANNNVIGKTEQNMQQIVNAFQVYEKQTGQSVNLANVTSNAIIYNFGSFMAYKKAEETPILKTYFLMQDGTRLTSEPRMFSTTTTNLPEYANPLPLSDTNWNDPDTPNNPGYCGDYPANQCLYIDITGRKAPNRIGKSGDIIPIRIDPSTKRIQTLYQWEKEDRGAAYDACRFVSAYDRISEFPGATNCN
jgi:prepilin-type N-terminal cleavage/methylation domain-containing protein